jgi:hypothetical protein
VWCGRFDPGVLAKGLTAPSTKVQTDHGWLILCCHEVTDRPNHHGRSPALLGHPPGAIIIRNFSAHRGAVQCGSA